MNLLVLIRGADELMALIGIVLVFLIPILAILTTHQRKMAEMLRRPESSSTNVELEIAKINETLRAHTLALDALLRSRELTQSDDVRNVEERLNTMGR